MRDMKKDLGNLLLLVCRLFVLLLLLLFSGFGLVNCISSPAVVVCPLSCCAVVLLSVMLISSVDDDDDVDNTIKLKKIVDSIILIILLTIIMVYFRNDVRIWLISMYDLYYEYLIVKLLFIAIWNADRRI